MAFKVPPKVMLFNALSTSSVVVSGGVITIAGLPSFNVDDVADCYRTCTTACTPQVVVVTPVVPTAPCECPWSFDMQIRKKSCGFERIADILEHNYSYNYTNPNGDPPTVALIIASVVAQINSDPNSIVTAVDTGDAHTTITLTEKDCDTANRTCGFVVTGNSLTQSQSTAHVDAVLPIWEVQRNFPITPGSDFSNPVTAFCGSEYCKYYLHIHPINKIRDPHVANGWVEKDLEVEIWVNADLANITTDWDTELTGALTCLGAPLT